MKLSEIATKNKMYEEHEITIDGIVHRKRRTLDIWYLSNSEMTLADISKNEYLIINWAQSPIRELDDSQKSEVFQQLKQLLLKNMLINPTVLENHLDKRWRHDRLKGLVYVNGLSRRFVENPFIDSDIEAIVLQFFHELTDKTDILLYPELLSRTSRKLPYECWHYGNITGLLKYSNGQPILSDVWKAVIPTINSNAYVIVGDKHNFIDTFESKVSIPVRQVLLEPETFYNQQITVRGLFTNDFVEFGNDIRYARLVPNRLYYEYRSKWDNRVSIHLKPSRVTENLTSFHHNVPGENPETAPNRGSAEVRITGTLYPPENKHSSIILDDITELVSIHNGLIHHWKPETLEHGLKLES